jgi:hypothetical protein
MKKAISNFAISFILLIAGANISFAQTDNNIQITSQPQDASVTTKDRRGNPSAKNISATFNVVATGQNLTYQWQYSLDRGVTWSNVSAATLSSLKVNNIVNADDSTQYRVIVTGVGNSATSDVATLKVDESIKIGGLPITIPGSQTQQPRTGR